jgi:HK97 family phage major capsid protein
MSTTAVPGASELDAVRLEATKKAEARIKEIWAIGRESEKRGVKDAAKAAEAAIDNDATAEEFRRAMFAAIPAATPMAPTPESSRKEGAFLDLSPADLGRYSLRKLLLALADGDWSKAGFERECSAAVADSMGVQARGALMPNDILADPRFARYHGAAIPFMTPEQRTTLLITSGTNALLGTDHLGGSFIELLRTRAVCLQAGAIVLDGLVGNIDIPRQTGGGAFEWVAEDAGATADANPVFEKVNAVPNTATSRQPLSRRLLLQGNPSAEGLVRDDLLAIIALGVDVAMLRGTGGTQPQGIVGSSGVGSVDHGPTGGAPSWAKVVEFETDVSDANADFGSLAYVSTPKVRGKLKSTDKGSVSVGNYLMADDGTVNGYPFFTTKNLRDDRTDGAGSALSEMLFGNFRDAILCMWGALDFVMDTSTDINKGGLILRVFQDVDVVVRHGGSFSYAFDIITV